VQRTPVFSIHLSKNFQILFITSQASKTIIAYNCGMHSALPGRRMVQSCWFGLFVVSCDSASKQKQHKKETKIAVNIRIKFEAEEEAKAEV